MAKALKSVDAPEIDTERFRLRRFMDRLIQAGEVDIHDEPIELAGIAEILDGNPKAVLIRKAGPEEAELVGNVIASRKRLAMALDVEPDQLRQEVTKRLMTPQEVVEIDRVDAPVQEIVLTGDDIDLTQFPIHLQHGMDGGPYISASLDYAVDEKTGWTNTGCRRLMLRNKRQTGIDLLAPSDLKAIYEASAAQGKPLPVSFTVGSHPCDHMAGTMRVPMDELELLARLRGTALPVVKSITNDNMVPADAEIVIEGFLDARGHVETEGPYGEFLGYYGVMKNNPLFTVTAITMRGDALFQTSTIGGKTMAHTDTANLCSVRTEVTVWRALESAVREPVSVHASPSNGGAFNVRISMRQRVPGEARNAIAAAMGSQANAKNVFVVDDDIDVYSDQQMDWALATRFQADRDMVVSSGFRTLPLDPSLDGRRTGSKAGYDLTIPFGERPLEFTVPAAPEFSEKRLGSVRESLTEGPKSFAEIMSDLGSRDGREVALELDKIREEGILDREKDGRYFLAAGQ
jgi:2,5-furandicarboxylate decarboxylase 1